MAYISLPKLKCKTGLRARLLLRDGTTIEGCGFGAPSTRVGEVVFSTGMTGYTEALTDPSFAGQILVWTHPMVGCYGVPAKEHEYCGVPLDYESDRIQVEGFIVSELPPPNHYLSTGDLDAWLMKYGIPGMYRADTRFLVKKIREYGVMMGVLAVFSEKEEILWSELEKRLKMSESYDAKNFSYLVSPRSVVVHEPIGRAIATVSVLDCGIKYGIVRWLLRQGFKVVRYPCWTDSKTLIDSGDGVVLSNGPGNPEVLKEQIKIVREVVESGRPVLGICLGMQLISLALGSSVYKLRYGHRGPNKGVIDVITKRSYITTQNHGYAVDESGLEASGLVPWFKNIDDGSLEGVMHKELPVIATQFHPEGGPGPHDTTWIFNRFRMMVKNGREY
ncbi:MAG: glutamine-hydrolyzing carbamoyl-phosphate synthase small subunit [Ignisphaera sp.]|nr:glutamine-hydrolyzing carbamoyl-phosphate synthase small subunit [Ignisphaera sp.]MCX8167580.1 glutamine-hydrolyzing carbamoyl-phosphate synthase small subunit [Ignisphaera sp.]MDW8085400.1 glutamine-hydrolyzing carbamoyl-phosphate synthase small subunit [Ignisphaera sp.]